MNIEKTILKSISSLYIKHLKELPDDEDIIYNEDYHRDNLISELEFDFSRIKYTGKLPLEIKEGKCNFCYPNNKTYTFHSPISGELIIRCVLDKIDDKNYLVQVCENKLNPKQERPINNNLPF